MECVVYKMKQSDSHASIRCTKKVLTSRSTWITIEKGPTTQRAVALARITSLESSSNGYECNRTENSK